MRASAVAVAWLLGLSGCQQTEEPIRNDAPVKDDADAPAPVQGYPAPAAGPDTPVRSDGPAARPAPLQQADGDCPIVSSTGWGAWIEKKGEENILTVSGRVTLPSAGYRTSLVFGETREINPPSQTVRLVVRAPEGPSAQVITEKEVVEQFNGLPRYSEVIITCGGQTIGRVGKVVTAL